MLPPRFESEASSTKGQSVLRRAGNVSLTGNWETFTSCKDWLMEMREYLKDFIENGFHREMYRITRCFRMCEGGSLSGSYASHGTECV
ncbi:hypothetical protein CEXT_115911 [Caerostris extrusa]|uniref:Uncharacterized protein n=1 Tax=Caerostris extrusa TaxID=172846 RepID=A0AAV4T5S5_CAEEX|nr:hypothetical protein CEXT_115911 [Caerostris extrusa]